MAASTSRGSESQYDEDDEPLLTKRKSHYDAHFDITAMIDLVFMLNIFFLVTTVVAAQAEIDLPTVRHCVPTDPDEAVMISLVAIDSQTLAVTAGDDSQNAGLTERDDQIRAIRQAVEEGTRAGKRIVLLRAERGVRLKDVKRIGAAAMKDVTGMELRMAVIETE